MNLTGHTVSTLALVLLLVMDAVFACVVDWEHLRSLQGLAYLGVRTTTAIVVAGRRAALSLNTRPLILSACLWSFVQPYGVYFMSLTAAMRDSQLANTFLTLSSLLSLAVTITLGRSFGVRPALRELVCGGPFRIVRHPLYATYVIADVALLYLLPSLPILLLIVSGWVALGVRIAAEERALSVDPAWRDYAGVVRNRLIPFLL